jgi:hypothetical protein
MNHLFALLRSEHRVFLIPYLLLGVFIVGSVFYMPYALMRQHDLIESAMPTVVAVTQTNAREAAVLLAPHLKDLESVGLIVVRNSGDRTQLSWVGMSEDSCEDVREYLTQHPSVGNLLVTKNGQWVNPTRYEAMVCDKSQGDRIPFTFIFSSARPKYSVKMASS